MKAMGRVVIAPRTLTLQIFILERLSLANKLEQFSAS